MRYQANVLPDIEVPAALREGTQVESLKIPIEALGPWRHLALMRVIQILVEDAVKLVLIHLLAEKPVDTVNPQARIQSFDLTRWQ